MPGNTLKERWLYRTLLGIMGARMLGVFVTTIASIFGALGDNLVRLSFLKERAVQKSQRRQLYRRPLWLLGTFFSTILDTLLTIVSLFFASAAIVTPFAGLHIVWNVLLAKYFLNERVLYQHVVGSIIILFGLTFVLIFGFHENLDYNLNDLIHLYTQNAFLVYSISSTGIIVFCICVTLSPPGEHELLLRQRHYLRVLPSAEKPANEIHKCKSSTMPVLLTPRRSFDIRPLPPFGCHATQLGSSVSNASIDEDLKLNSEDPDSIALSERAGERRSFVSPSPCSEFKHKRIVNSSRKHSSVRGYFPSSIRRFCTAAASGVCGGNSNIVLQNVMKVLDAEGYKMFVDYRFILIAISLVFLGFAQLYFLNLGLASYETVFVVPTTMSLLIATACIAGLSLYTDSIKLSPMNMMLFGAGALAIICGIAILAAADVRREDENEDQIARQMSHRIETSLSDDPLSPAAEVIGNLIPVTDSKDQSYT